MEAEAYINNNDCKSFDPMNLPIVSVLGNESDVVLIESVGKSKILNKLKAY